MFNLNVIVTATVIVAYQITHCVMRSFSVLPCRLLPGSAGYPRTLQSRKSLYSRGFRTKCPTNTN